MATHFTIRHTFPIDVDTFWAKVFFDEEYNRRLYTEALGFTGFKQLEKKEDADGAIRRKIWMEPRFDAPAVLKKVVGDSLSYTELGRFDPKTKKWHYEITPSRYPEKITIRGDFWAEARGEKQIERICTVEIDARIFGIGGALEGYIEKQTKESYEQTAAFTRKWIAEKAV